MLIPPIIRNEQDSEHCLLRRMYAIEGDLNLLKPEERGELARRYSIVITEIEKVIAYYKTYIVDR